MKKSCSLLLPIFLITLLASGCIMVDSSLGIGTDDSGPAIVGSGHALTRSYGFSNFSKIYVSHGFKARIERGSSYAVQVNVDDNIEPYLQVRQSGDEIFIGLENRTYRDVTLSVTIRTPDVNLINASGAAAITMTGFDVAHDVQLIGSGASVIRGDLVASTVTMMVSGASAVDLTGRSNAVNINLSGASVMHMLGFPVKTCKAVLSGGSVSDLSVSDSLEVTVTGASVLRYKGNPVVRIVSVTGGSVVQKID